ncbi:MAG: hypothetical protein AAF318_10920 [Pseudomonadota bacterium]
MISSIIDAVLLTALAATSVCVLLMYRRLQRFDALQNEAAAAFARSAAALEHAKGALDNLNANSGEMAVSLAQKLNEARLVINEIDKGISPRRSRTPEPEEMTVPDIARGWERDFASMHAEAMPVAFAPVDGQPVPTWRALAEAAHRHA